LNKLTDQAQSFHFRSVKDARSKLFDAVAEVLAATSTTRNKRFHIISSLQQ